MMHALNHQQRTAIELIALVCLAIVLSVLTMVMDSKGQLLALRSSVQTYISNPIKSSTDLPERFIRQVNVFVTERRTLQAENERLKREVTWLRANLSSQTILKAEYRRLKSLFDTMATQTMPVAIAEILDSYIDDNKHQIEINKGKQDDVYLNQIAIDTHGVVGQVVKLSDRAAIISLITDVRQRIPVFIKRNRLRMVARGGGDLNTLIFDFVGKNADVRVGDTIVTSGLGNRYPRGHGIGVITEVRNTTTSDFKTVRAEPLAELDKILEVLLIKSM